MVGKRVHAWLCDGGLITWRQFMLCFGLLFLLNTIALAGIGYAAHENRKRAREGQGAHAALCASKTNLRSRVAGSEAFLNAGGAIPGVPNALLRSGLARDHATLRALDVLKCPDDPVASPP